MRLYNSLSQKKENLRWSRNRRLRLFVCGPTVFDYSHIGHARTYIFFDTLVRYLRSLGFKIFYLQNITNIDDKIIERAKIRKITPFALARFFEKTYRADMKKIGIGSVTRYARASDFIPAIVKQIQTLIKKGYAYKTRDGYYYDITKFKDYGKLSRRTALQAEDAVSRIDEATTKKNKGDFALWKFSKPDEPSWPTALGIGRPGWHIEDTAISESFFGPQYEVHGGALDLKFPHHEAEIAEQEAASGKTPFVKIWLHTGFLTVHGEKMSKSLKNFVTIRDFLKKHSAAALRLMILKHHYRTPLNYSETVVAGAEKDLENFRDFFAKLELISRKGESKKTNRPDAKNLIKNFEAALENDFNTPGALAAIFKFMNTVQNEIFKASRTEAAEVKKTVGNLLARLGLEVKTPVIPLKLKKLVKARELFRRNKQFTQADALRKKIGVLGYGIEDTPFGPLLLPKNPYAKNKNKNSAARSRS